MPRQPGHEDSKSGGEQDPIAEGLEIEFEDDRFSTNDDDSAGRCWQINSDLVEREPDERPREIEDEGIERGVFRTRSISTTRQDTDVFGRFTAEEAREPRVHGTICKRIRSTPLFDDGSRASYDGSRAGRAVRRHSRA